MAVVQKSELFFRNPLLAQFTSTTCQNTHPKAIDSPKPSKKQAVGEMMNSLSKCLVVAQSAAKGVSPLFRGRLKRNTGSSIDVII